MPLYSIDTPHGTLEIDHEGDASTLQPAVDEWVKSRSESQQPTSSGIQIEQESAKHLFDGIPSALPPKNEGVQPLTQEEKDAPYKPLVEFPDIAKDTVRDILNFGRAAPLSGNTPELSDQDLSKATGIARGIQHTAQSLTSPMNAALMVATGGAPTIVQKGAALYFAGQAAKQVPEQLAQASAATDPAEKSQAYTEAALNGLVAVLAFGHANGRVREVPNITPGASEEKINEAIRAAPEPHKNADIPDEMLDGLVASKEAAAKAVESNPQNETLKRLNEEVNRQLSDIPEDRQVAAQERIKQKSPLATERISTGDTQALDASELQKKVEEHSANGDPAPLSAATAELSAKSLESEPVTEALPEASLNEPAYVGGPGAMSPVEAGEMASNQNPTGLKRAIVDTERLTRGAEEIPTPERQREEKVVQQAEYKLDADPTAAPALVAKIVDQGSRAITEQDAAVLLVERQKLMNERRSWEEKIGRGEDVESGKSRLGEIEGELDRIDRAQRSAGTTWGRLGHMYQRLIREDFTLEAMESKMRAAKGDKLTPEESAKIRDDANKIKELQDKLDAARSKSDTAQVDSEVSRLYEATINELGKSYLDKPAYGKQVFDIARQVVDRWKSEVDEASKTVKDWLGAEGGGVGGVGGGKGGGRKLGQQNNAAQQNVIVAIAKIVRAKIGEFGLSKAEAASELISEFGPKIKPLINGAWDKAQELIRTEKTPEKVKEVTKKGVSKKGEKTPVEAKASAKADQVAGEPLSHQTVYELARAHVNAGIHGENAVMSAVFNDLKELYAGLTERDVRRAYSEYGKAQFPSQDAVKKELRELRALTRMQESIDRLKEGADALKTGLQRDKATQVVREKQKQLNELLKQRQGPPTKEQLATRDEAKQTALRNAITDLDKQLRTGEKPTTSTPIPDSPKTEQLRAERDAMRSKLKEIEDAAKPKPTADELAHDTAQKGVDAASSAMDRWDKILKGEIKPESKSPIEAKSGLEEELRSQVDAMKQAFREIQKAEKPSSDKEAARQKSQLQSLEKSIAEYERRVDEMDFSPRPERHGVDTKAVADAKTARDAAKKAYEDLKEAQKPINTPQEIYNEKRLKFVEKRAQELQAKIDAGDFTRKAKPETPQKTREVKDAEFALESKKKQFNEGLFHAEIKNRSAPRKAFDLARDVLNTSRAVMTSFDLSAVLRQGGFIALAHPVRALKSFPAMMRAFASEKGQFEVNKEIQERPNSDLYKQSKLFLNDPGDYRLSKMEEQYMTRWAAKIPGVAHAERAYVTFLNKLRADSFDAMADAVGSGKPISPEEGKAIANFVNVATGRGNLAGAAGSAISLNTAFFSPRFVVSRFELLAGQPLYRGTAATRIAVAKEYARYLTALGVIYGLAKMSGGTVETDPRASDFGKIKFGDTRVDLLSGLSQATVLESRMITGETKSPSGQVKSIRGNIPFGQPDSADVAGRFLRTKLSPSIGSLVDVSAGSDVMGNPVTPATAAARMVVPLSFGDIYSAMRDQGVAKGTAIALLALLGAGVQVQQKKNSPK